MNNISIEGFSLLELLSIFDSQVESNDFYDCLAQEIVKLDESILIERFNTLTDVQKRGAIFGLSTCKTIALESKEFIKQIALCVSENDLVRADSLRALVNLNAELDWLEFEMLLKHNSEYIRASALLLASYLLPDVDSIFQESIKDKSPVVRETIIDEIADKEYKKLFDIVKPYIDDDNENVSQAAKYFFQNQKGPE